MRELARRYPHLFAAWYRWLYREAMRQHRTPLVEREAPSVLTLTWRGEPVTVRKNVTHPERYGFIEIRGRVYFLGVIQPGDTRGDVRRMARTWLRERHNSFSPCDSGVTPSGAPSGRQRRGATD